MEKKNTIKKRPEEEVSIHLQAQFSHSDHEIHIKKQIIYKKCSKCGAENCKCQVCLSEDLINSDDEEYEDSSSEENELISKIKYSVSKKKFYIPFQVFKSFNLLNFFLFFIFRL